MRPGESRSQIALALKSAYSEGLLSQDTFVRRLDQVLAGRLIDPLGLLGDLTARRSPRRFRRRVPGLARVRSLLRSRTETEADTSPLLALDWEGGQTELTLGRHYGCDIVVSGATVSRHHACLVYRDGLWTLHDLQSTNGTTVNGARVEHCVLAPGDDLRLGAERLRIN